MKLPVITKNYRADLEFPGRYADLVALSFVNSVDDVRELRIYPATARRSAAWVSC